jgi:hypothetical protein
MKHARPLWLVGGLAAGACTATPALVFDGLGPDASVADGSVPTAESSTSTGDAPADAPAPALDAAPDAPPPGDGAADAALDAGADALVPTGCPNTTPSGWGCCFTTAIACKGNQGNDCNAAGCGQCTGACDAAAPWCCRKSGTVCSTNPNGC